MDFDSALLDILISSQCPPGLFIRFTGKITGVTVLLQNYNFTGKGQVQSLSIYLNRSRELCIISNSQD